MNIKHNPKEHRGVKATRGTQGPELQEQAPRRPKTGRASLAMGRGSIRQKWRTEVLMHFQSYCLHNGTSKAR